ncbi:hypothetical protein [Paenibacillus sp. 32O-W]|uniref:hypothetical protein n=1 Tax=Paenibacillus sp. 32O-W TaxID=1695218 RepID=UPI00164269F0|nr:hypothetical protein [Paenibacillus sp. 32O-W]
MKNFATELERYVMICIEGAGISNIPNTPSGYLNPVFEGAVAFGFGVLITPIVGIGVETKERSGASGTRCDSVMTNKLM